MARLVLILFISAAFFGNLDRIRKSIEKNDFKKAITLIEKGLEKDSNNPGLFYFKSILYLNEEFADKNIDSARIFIQLAKDKLPSIVEELKEDLLKDGVSGHLIDSLFKSIRQTLYTSTLNDLRIESIQTFKSWYPTSIYDRNLEFKLDSILFEKSKEQHTIEGYEDYIKRRPESPFINKADSIINYLDFKNLMNETSLLKYYDYLENKPDSKYRKEVETFILKNSTAKNDTDVFLDFLSIAKDPKLRKKAGDILFHLGKNVDLNYHPISDSLRKSINRKKTGMFPYVENNKVGFASNEGDLLLPPIWDEIDQPLKCEVSHNDWLLVQNDDVGYISDIQGYILIKNVGDFKDLGFGVCLVEINGQKLLYHKSGFLISEKVVEDAEVLNGKWISIKRNGKWGLYSFLNYKITQSNFDKIEAKDSLWIFEKDGLLALEHESYINKNLNQNGLILEFKFDDIEFFENQTIIGFKDNRECLLNEDLDFLIPWGNYEINPDESGWIVRDTVGYRFYNEVNKNYSSEYYQFIESNPGWTAMKTERDWILISKSESLLPSRGYDSVKIINDAAAYVITGNYGEIIFQNGTRIQLNKKAKIRAINQLSNYFYLESSAGIALYDATGNKVFNLDLEKMTYFNDSTFIVEKNKKYGLLTINGEYIVPPSYDFIDEKNDLIQLLKRGKIGVLDISRRSVISPAYDAIIEKVGSFYKVNKWGKFGLVNEKNKTILENKYQEIFIWNDSSFLVQLENDYDIINLLGEPIIENIEKMEVKSEYKNSTIWSFIKEGKYGLISNEYGVILKPEFSEIINIGSQENPFFFAEQNLQTAGFHVVSYVNKMGELVLSKAYTNEEFNKILCDD